MSCGHRKRTASTRAFCAPTIGALVCDSIIENGPKLMGPGVRWRNTKNSAGTVISLEVASSVRRTNGLPRVGPCRLKVLKPPCSPFYPFCITLMLVFDPHFSLLRMTPAALANRSLCVYGLLIVLPLFCLTVLVVRRLFFHPLSRFPGPRLAALTPLYKSYHEVIRGGKWLHHADSLHEFYGTSISPPHNVTPV